MIYGFARLKRENLLFARMRERERGFAAATAAAVLEWLGKCAIVMNEKKRMVGGFFDGWLHSLLCRWSEEPKV